VAATLTATGSPRPSDSEEARVTTEERIESSELHEYRLEAREWIARNLTWLDHPPPDDDNDPPPERIAWARDTQAKLHDAGYAGFTFPVEYGGQGLTRAHEFVFVDEAKGYDVPFRFFGVSIGILGATLIACGSQEQKLRHVPKILSGEERWLQFLSEPSGGSDLAGLLTSATRDGDNFIVNGQKTWSTGAHLSDFGFCPVRTRWDVPKHRGISVLIIDLKSPGLEIRRIKQINGASEFCEEFFTDVVVPASNLIGDENDGWRVTRALLEIEHLWPGRAWTRRADAALDIPDLVALAKQKGLDDDVGGVRRKVVGLHVATEVQKLLAGRVSRGTELGVLAPGYGSLLKLGNDQLFQRRAAVALELAGSDGVVWEPDVPAARGWAHTYLTSRSRSIAGGTDEIQRNNVSEHVLGLPREPYFDRDIPFNQVPHN
jgi:alkylation response protein AidB-like acyl-CoA dehydrogenase